MSCRVSTHQFPDSLSNRPATINPLSINPQLIVYSVLMFFLSYVLINGMPLEYRFWTVGGKNLGEPIFSNNNLWMNKLCKYSLPAALKSNWLGIQ